MSERTLIRENVWQLPPEAQASLDAANRLLAELADKHAPAKARSVVPPKMAHELVDWGQFKLKPSGAALLSSDLSSQEFFARLVQNDCLADARRVLAHSLPKRRALWWGVLSAWDASRPAPSAELRSVLEAVTQFVMLPTEDSRRAVGELGQRCAANTIASCLANAAFFSSGSVSPQGLPPVAPKPFVTGRLVGVCVYLAAVTRSPALYKQYLREYLRWGVAISEGRLLWTQPGNESFSHSRLDQYWNMAPPHLSVSTHSPVTVGASP